VVPGATVGLGFLAGMLSCHGRTCGGFYRAFEMRKIGGGGSAPAVYPALTLSLSWMTGERVIVVRIAGIICTLVGVVVVAGGEKTPDGTLPRPCQERRPRNGLGHFRGGWFCHAVLAARNSHHRPRRRDSNRLDDSLDTRCSSRRRPHSKQLCGSPREVRWMVLVMGGLILRFRG